MTLAQIKAELNVKTLDFFNILDDSNNPTDWCRARTIHGDSLNIHVELLEKIKTDADTAKSTKFFIKRKVYEANEQHDEFTSYVLCLAEKESVLSI